MSEFIIWNKNNLQKYSNRDNTKQDYVDEEVISYKQYRIDKVAKFLKVNNDNF